MTTTAERNARVIEFAHTVAQGVLNGTLPVHDVVNNYARRGKGWYAFERGLKQALGNRYMTPDQRADAKAGGSTSLVFVYGTLKRGYHNHRLLVSSNSLGPAVTVDRMAMTSASIPFVFREVFVPNKSALGHIVGELYEVTRRVRDSLDRLEGHPKFYTRTPVKVRLLNTEARIRLDGALVNEVDAEMYLIEHAPWQSTTSYVPSDSQNHIKWHGGR